MILRMAVAPSAETWRIRPLSLMRSVPGIGPLGKVRFDARTQDQFPHRGRHARRAPPGYRHGLAPPAHRGAARGHPLWPAVRGRFAAAHAHDGNPARTCWILGRRRRAVSHAAVSTGNRWCSGWEGSHPPVSEGDLHTNHTLRPALTRPTYDRELQRVGTPSAAASHRGRRGPGSLRRSDQRGSVAARGSASGTRRNSRTGRAHRRRGARDDRLTRRRRRGTQRRETPHADLSR